MQEANKQRAAIDGFLDCETTGLRAAHHGLLEFTLRALDKDGQEVAVYQSGDICLQTGDSITEEALECNGFTAARCWTGRKIEVVRQEFMAFIEANYEAPVSLIGHNVSFDYQFMEKLFGFDEKLLGRYISHRKTDGQMLCLLQNRLNGTPNKSTSLASMRKEYGLTSEGAHTSRVDTAHGLIIYQEKMNELFHNPQTQIRVLSSELARLRKAIEDLKRYPAASPEALAWVDRVLKDGQPIFRTRDFGSPEEAVKLAGLVGGQVWFEAGQYKLHNTIQVPEGVSLKFPWPDKPEQSTWVIGKTVKASFEMPDAEVETWEART